MSTSGSNNRVTISGNKLPGVKRIISALESAGSEPMRTKDVALKSGLAYSYVRRLLPQLARSELIRKIGHGYYTANLSPPATEVRFENIVLTSRTLTNAVPRGAGYITLTQTRLDKLSRRATGFAGPSAPLITKTWFGERSVYVQEFPNGTTTIQCGSKGGPSMSILDLISFFGWVRGSYPNIPDSGEEGWYVKSWEANRDFANLRLDFGGLKPTSISFRVFENVIVKFYQKVTGLRMEIRAVGSLPLDKAIDYANQLATKFAQLGLINTGIANEDAK